MGARPLSLAAMNNHVQDAILLLGDSLTQGASMPHGFAQRLSCRWTLVPRTRCADVLFQMCTTENWT